MARFGQFPHYFKTNAADKRSAALSGAELAFGSCLTEAANMKSKESSVQLREARSSEKINENRNHVHDSQKVRDICLMCEKLWKF